VEKLYVLHLALAAAAALLEVVVALAADLYRQWAGLLSVEAGGTAMGLADRWTALDAPPRGANSAFLSPGESPIRASTKGGPLKKFDRKH
jgi:hypothetical protein